MNMFKGNNQRAIIFSALLAISAANTYFYGQILDPQKGYNDKWGFVDAAGKVAIPFEYDLVDGFVDGLAAVQQDWKWGFVDNTGKAVIPLKYDWVEGFSEGLSISSYNGKLGVIDKSDKVIIPFEYKWIYAFSEGLAVAQQFNGKCGGIDKTGKVIIPFKYDFVWEFREGVAMVQLNDKFGFIDNTDTELVSIKYTQSKALQKLNTKNSKNKIQK
jgi:hypothetical protein